MYYNYYEKSEDPDRPLHPHKLLSLTLLHPMASSSHFDLVSSARTCLSKFLCKKGKRNAFKKIKVVSEMEESVVIRRER